MPPLHQRIQNTSDSKSAIHPENYTETEHVQIFLGRLVNEKSEPAGRRLTTKVGEASM